MRTRLSTTFLVAAAVATLTAQSGQPPRDLQDPDDQQPLIFRAESNFIRVDMYPTRDGQFVTDLRADEVEVLEDGVPQRIETFELVRIPAGGDRTAGTGDAVSPLDSRSRVFVVFVDTHTTPLDRDSALRLSLVRYLDRLLGPDDLVGLMTPDMAAGDVTLGLRSTVISDVANDDRWVRRSTERQDLKEFAWENCYPARGAAGRAAEMKARRRARLTIDALQDLVLHLRDVREERKAVLLVTSGWLFTGDSALASGGRAETETCYQDRQDLLGTNYGHLLRDLTRAANRANVSFYPVNSRQVEPVNMEPVFRGGVAINPAMIRQRNRRILELSQEQLDMLAEETDGLAEAGTSNLEKVTRRIIDDTSAYYLLGYQSTNTSEDGRFRSITVKVRRPGVRVRARPGYGGDTPGALSTSADVPAGPLVDSRITSALTTVERFDTSAPVWLRSSTWVPEGTTGGAFWFTGEVGAPLRTHASWKRGATADVEVLASDRTQLLAKTFSLEASDGAFSLRVPESGHLPPGDYAVRVRLQADADGTTVHDSVRVTVNGVATGPGAPILWRRGSSSRLEYLETADPRFRRTERLRLEFPTRSDAPPVARMLDRLGQPLRIPAPLTARRDPSGDFGWIVVEAPLAGLAPGDYAIELTQDGGSQVTAFRVIP